MSSFFSARVLSLAPEADALFDLQLEVEGTPAEGTHVHPGQYALLSTAGLPSQPFAIASAPGARVFEFLVKGGPGLAGELTQVRPGQRVEITAAKGKGFPLELARGRNVLLFATGSGISAIRSTLLAIRQDRDAFGSVTLYFGARTPTAFAYMDEHAGWEADRIRVVRTVTQPGESGWTGLTGYVQQHLPQEPHENAIAFLCGQPEMVRGVSETLSRNGVSSDRVFLNY